MTENPVRDAIQEAISDHEIILFMKGTPERPMCGFSARTTAALEALGTEYAAVDVLPDPRIRQELSRDLQLADDPPAVRQGRAGRRLRHRHRDVRVAASWRRRSASSRPPRRRSTRRPPPSRARRR